MNILIPHKWLLEHLETSAKPEDIQKYVSLCGPSIERIYDREGDKVYDIEVTTNRVDSMSIRGIAREAAVILNQFGIKSKLIPSRRVKTHCNASLPLPIINNHPTLNKRTMCVILSGIKRNPTPKWMADKLTQTEMNVHDAAIDITNYVTHELGHPCHAFDYDKLMNTGGEINIVETKKGETFTTLDGNEFTTVGGEVVFKNGEGLIIDLPSIKGTANTSIDESSKNVLLLMESIDPQRVRFASMTHAIRTTAAQLMEKNVDPHLMEPTMDLAINLYTDLCNASVASEIYDDYPGEKDLAKVKVKKETIDEYLGIELEIEKIVKILEDLECKVEVKKENAKRETHNTHRITVTPPTFRPDLKIPADIVEEIARIYGYHNLPSILMPTAIPTNKPDNTDFHMENKIKHFLADIGWQEVYTYSMVSEEIAQASGFEISDHLKIQNELTEDRVYMRRSLIPSLEEVIDQNPMRKELSVFEIANLYHPQKNDIPVNETHLSLVSNKAYRQVKGNLESLLAQFFIKKVSFEISKEHSSMFSQMANISAHDHSDKKVTIGKIGILQSGKVAAGIALLQLIKVVNKHPNYEPIPTTAIITEDLTFTISTDVLIGDVISSIKSVDKTITDVQMGEIYKNNYTFTISYHDSKTNLSSEDIKPIREKLVKKIEQEYKAKLVGEI